MSEISLDKILNQLRGFNVTEFEKSLSPEEVEKFRPYIINFHKITLRYEALLRKVENDKVSKLP